MPVWFVLDGEEIQNASPARLRELRGSRIGMIFQEPMTALNPVLTVGMQIRESLAEHTDLDASARKTRAIELLDKAVEGVKSVVRPSGLPLVGQVAAGSPVLAEENIEEYIEVPQLAGGEDGEYLLRVRGDSMKNAGIIEDDVVVNADGTSANATEIPTGQPVACGRG